MPQAPWGLSAFEAGPLLSSAVSSCPWGMFAQRAPTRPCTLSHSVPYLSCCSLVLLTVQARSCRGHSDSPTSHGGPWTLPLKHRSSQPAAAPRGESSCLRGSAGPPFWASCPVSPRPPPSTQQPERSFQNTRQAMRALWPSVLHPFPGRAPAPPAPHWPFPSGTLSTVLLSRGAPSCPTPLHIAVLCAWGALSFLVEVTNSPYPSSVGSASPGGKHRLP